MAAQVAFLDSDATDGSAKQIMVSPDNPLPVTIISGGGGGGGGDVNLIQIGGQAVTAGAGNVAAGTQRITLAADDPAVTALQLIDNVIGTKAPGTAAANSALVGGVYNATLPTLSDTQQASVQLGLRGALRVEIVSAGATQGISSYNPATDGLGATGATMAATSFSLIYNGTNWDRVRGTNGRMDVSAVGSFVTVTTTITRPADTTAYTANDVLANSTSAPTVGGNTLTGAGRISGGSGIITDIVIVSSNEPGTLLQGELWIFDSAVTAVNDNAAFALSDADALKLVGVVPFTLVGSGGGNSVLQVSGLNYGFTAVGAADLRFLVKVKNAYTPASAETLTIRAKIVQMT